MFSRDSKMATLKAGGATTATVNQTTKLMLPHEVLVNGTQTAIGASNLTSGHSTAIILPNNFYHNSFQTSFYNSNDSSQMSSSTTASGLPLKTTTIANNFLQNNFGSHIIPNSSAVSYSIAQSNNSNLTSVQNISAVINTNNLQLMTTNSVNPLTVSSTAGTFTTTPNQHQSYIAAATNDKSSSSNSNFVTYSNNSQNNQHHPTTSNEGNESASLSTKSGIEARTSSLAMENKNSNIVASTKEIDVATNFIESNEEEPEIDIVISNVVCSFSVRCHLNLRTIALNGFNVEFRRENGMVTMKLRRPYTTASIWSSGRITCTGATSEDQAKIAARRYARSLQKLGFRVRFNNFRIVNVLGTCSMPWAIKITQFSEKYRKEASYEPELHPGVTYKLKEPKATLKIFSTGSITVTAASVAFVQQAIEHIYPLVYEFRKKRTPEEERIIKSHQSAPTVEDTDEFNADDLIEVDEDYIEETAEPSSKRRRPFGKVVNDPDEDMMNVSDPDVEDLSDVDDL